MNRHLVSRLEIALAALCVIAGPCARAAEPPAKGAGSEKKTVKQIQVVVSGTGVDEKRIRAGMATREGDPMSEETVEEDIKNIHATGLVEKVDISAEDVAGGVRMIVKITGRGVVGDVAFVGNSRFDSKSLKSEVGVKPGQPADETKLFAGKDKIREKYTREGFADVTVDYAIRPMPDKEGFVRVTYTIAEGSRNISNAIRFKGLTALSESKLRSKMGLRVSPPSDREGKAGKLDNDMLQSDVRAIERAIQDQGYVYGKVTQVRREPLKADRVDLVFVIEEGKRFTVSEVALEGITAFTHKEVASGLHTLAGKACSLTGLSEDEELITDYYGSRGYADAQVESSIQPGKGGAKNTVKIVYRVTEGGKYTVGEINISGNERIKESVIRREFKLAPGDVFNTVLVDQARKALLQLGCFSQVDIRRIPTGVPGIKDIQVNVLEKGLDEKAVFGPVPEDIEETLLRIAESVERKEAGARPEVAGLVQRVKKLLAREAEPWPEEDESMDRRTKLLGALRLPDGSLDIRPGFTNFGGFVFNRVPDAMEGEIIELKARMESGEDVLRLLQRIRYLAGEIGDEEREQDYNQKAEKLARQRVEQEPKSAEAHALLADVLGWTDETRQETEREARRALELDPKCWRATLVLADGLANHAIHDLLPEGAPGLSEPHVEMTQLYRRIYDHPPDGARVAAMEKTLSEATALLDDAMQAAPNALELRGRAAGLKMGVPLWRGTVKLLREQRPDSFDQFNQMRNQLQAVTGMKGLDDSFRKFFGEDLRAIVKLAPDDGHLIGAAAILASLVPRILDGKTWDELPEATRSFVKDADAILQKMGGSPDPAAAAKAWEGDAALQAVIGSCRGPRGLLGEAAARAVALDPLRITAWDLLLGALVGNEKYAATRAAAEIRLAVLPTEGSHRQCAWAGKKTGDYPDCLVHLEAILEKKPEDLRTLVWMAGVRLRQGQGKETMNEVEKSLDHIRELYAAQRDSLKGEVVEDLMVNYAVFLALNGEESRAVTVVRSGLDDGRLPEEAGTKLLKILQP